MWNPELKCVRDRFERLGRSHQVAAQQGREARRLPEGLWEHLAKAGLFATYLREGRNEGMAYAAAAIEGLSSGLLDAGTGISLVSHLGLCLWTVSRYARPPLRERYLEPLSSGRALAAFATAEPHGGSDAQKLTARLTRSPAGFVLNGEKWSITNAPVASLIITTGREIATQHPISVLVDPAWPGVERQTLRPAGIKSSPTGRILFTDVEIPESHILGKVGEGIQILFDAFTRERVLAPFVFIGLMDRLTHEAFAYAQTRVVFDQPIGDFQYVRKRLTDMKIDLETTRAMAHLALGRYLSGEESGLEVSLAKMYSAAKATDAFTNAVKIFGSHRLEEGDLDELVMASLAGSIAGGTEEMHREVIYQSMYRQYRRNRGKENDAAARLE